MKSLFTLMLLCIFQFANSQCSGILKNEVDEFTNEKNIVVGRLSGVGYTLLGNKCDNCTRNIGFIGLQASGDTYLIYTLIYGKSPLIFDEGNDVFVKMQDGETYRYKVASTAHPNYSSLKEMYSTIVHFKITKHDLKLFLDSDFDKIRIDGFENNVVCRVHKKFKEHLECFYTLLTP